MSTEELARTIARADFTWGVGETGVMAINPETLDASFEKAWREDEGARRKFTYIAECVGRVTASEHTTGERGDG